MANRESEAARAMEGWENHAEQRATLSQTIGQPLGFGNTVLNGAVCQEMAEITEDDHDGEI